jgi:branched-chain amino acid transport system permease protein
VKREFAVGGITVTSYQINSPQEIAILAYFETRRVKMPSLSVFISALIISSTIVMMSTGLVLLYSIMGILNWTHGQFYMIGAFITYYLFVKLSINYFVALAAATVAVAVLGIAIERWLLHPLTEKGFLAVSVVGLGLVFVFQGLITSIFGTGLKSVPSVLQASVQIGSVSLGVEKIIIISLSLVVMLSLYLVVMRTKFGLAIQAAAQKPTVAALYGVNSARMFTMVMAIGSGLAGLAGGMIAPAYFVDPTIGNKPLIVALLSIVLGGLGSFRGAVVGGIILGFITSIGAYYFGPWYELISFGAVILMILIRPRGLFGLPETRL